ncbi:MAG: sulfatase [Zavarzinella sp.]
MKKPLWIWLFVLGCLPPVAGAERPNILFCFADDWGKYASCYAKTEAKPGPNSVIRTPNIDAIAKQGVLFTNAYVNAPSCTPCRSSLLTGRYFFRTNTAAILQGAVWDEGLPSFPLPIQQNGYHIGKSYKVWSPGTPADAPFGGNRFAYQKSGGRFNTFSQNVTKMVAGGTPLEQAKQELYQEVGGNFKSFLDAREEKKPFFYWFGPTNVHRKWVKGSGKALWKIDPEALKGKLPPFLPDVPEIREDFADYLGEIQAWDAGIGVHIEELKRRGELENTIIVISGDHGAPGFPGGKCNLYDFGTAVSLVVSGPKVPGNRVVDDFVSLIDLCPTFLELSQTAAFKDINGKSIVAVLQSTKSGQVDPDRSWMLTGRERHVAFTRDDNMPYPQRAIRTADYLYIRNFKPDRWPMGVAAKGDLPPSWDQLENDTYRAYADMDASPAKAWLVLNGNKPEWKWHFDYAFAKRPLEELFDLKTDPHQIKNVASDPAHQAAKAKLAAQLDEILKVNSDPRLQDAFDKPPFSDLPAQKKKNPPKKK